MHIRRFAIAVLVIATAACTDAGTRVAYDLESGAARLGAAEGSRLTVTHVPRSWPEGCQGGYRVTINAGSAQGDGHGNFRTSGHGLGVTCLGPEKGGGGTTYHLRFVDVAERLTVTKNANEPALIDLQRIGGRAVVVALH